MPGYVVTVTITHKIEGDYREVVEEYAERWESDLIEVMPYVDGSFVTSCQVEEIKGDDE